MKPVQEKSDNKLFSFFFFFIRILWIKNVQRNQHSVEYSHMINACNMYKKRIVAKKHCVMAAYDRIAKGHGSAKHHTIHIAI